MAAPMSQNILHTIRGWFQHDQNAGGEEEMAYKKS
jgi:hypothetical protein